MLEKFDFSIKNWSLVSEKGLPKDGEWCFLIWVKQNGEFDWSMGGYSEKESQFYVNFGFGGATLPEQEVYAWSTFDDVDLLHIKKIEK